MERKTLANDPKKASQYVRRAIADLSTYATSAEHEMLKAHGIFWGFDDLVEYAAQNLHTVTGVALALAFAYQRRDTNPDASAVDPFVAGSILLQRLEENTEYPSMEKSLKHACSSRRLPLGIALNTIARSRRTGSTTWL